MNHHEEKKKMRFDVNDWLRQGEGARVELKRAEVEILVSIQDKEKELVEVRAKLKRVEDILGEKTSDRRTGVLDLTRKVVAGLDIVRDDAGHDRGVSEEMVIQAVLEQDPLMKSSSIAGALRRMVKAEEVDRIGKRGHHRYRTKVSKANGTESDIATEASSPERIHAALVNVGSKGAHLNDLAWILGDNSATLIVLDKMMGDRVIETFPVGEGSFHYRLRADSVSRPVVDKGKVGTNDDVDPEPPTTAPSLFGAEPPSA